MTLKELASKAQGFIQQGIQRVGTSWKENPYQYTPMSMKSMIVPYAQTIGKGITDIFHTNPVKTQQVAQDIGYGLRGALSVTPFQSFKSISPVQQQIQNQSNPTTFRQKAAQSIGQGVYGTALTGGIAGGVPRILGNMAVGTTLGTGMGIGSDLLSGKGLPNKERLAEHALSGFQNSWVLPITNAVTSKLLSGIAPNLVGTNIVKPFVSGQVKEGFKRVFLRALSEVPLENTAFTFLNRMDDTSKETFMNAWIKNLPGAVVSNLLSAGVQGTWNTAINEQSRSAVKNAFDKTIQEWTVPVNTMRVDAQGNRVQVPMWRQALEDRVGLQVKDINRMSVEDYAKAKGITVQEAEKIFQARQTQSAGVGGAPKETYALPPDYVPKNKQGKPTQELGKKLYYLMKENPKYGNLLQTKAGYMYVLDRLSGGKADFNQLYTKYGDQRPTYKQWRMLYALSKGRGYDIDSYNALVGDMLNIKPAILRTGTTVSNQTPSMPAIQKGSSIKIKSPEEAKIKIQEQPNLSQQTKRSMEQTSSVPKSPSMSGNQDSSGSIIQPKSKYSYNVNTERLDVQPDEKKVLDTTIKTVQPELEKLKGKRLSNEEIVQAAKESEVLQSTVSREQTIQAEATLLKARQRVVELDKEITDALKNGDTTKVKASMKEFVDTLKVVSSNAADRGRQLQSLAIKAGDESVRANMIKDLMKVESNTDKLIEEASKVDWNNANAVAQFYRKYIKPSAKEIFDEFRYNNMLSNPRTHIRNAFSNMMQTFITRPATLVAQGKPMAAMRYYGGAVKSIPDAFDAFVKSMKGELPMEKPDIEHIPTMKLPKFMTIPTRAMEAGDVFFSTIIKGGETARGASASEAKNIASYSLFRQGLKPEGQGKILNAIDNATEAVYTLGQKIPAFRWFVPFVRTPMNFAKQWLEYSPAGLSTTIGSKNPREQVAKAVLGSVVTAVGAKIAMEGRTTWAAPTDPKEKEAFYASGRKPYSIKIGDKWVSMQFAGPFGLSLALPAAVKYYTEDSRTALTDSQMEKLTKIISASVEYMSGQTFLEGMGNFVKMATGDADYTMPKNLAYTASQVIPFQGLVRWITTMIDPVYRKASGVGEQFQSNIPFLSKELRPYTMPNGEPSTREGYNLFTPYDIVPERPEYNQELLDRTKKLQENAVKNKLIKDAEEGEVRTQGTYVPVKNSNGNWTVVDTSFQPEQPELTGSPELDKKIISKFNGEITQKANDIYDLYKAGKLTEAEAEQQLTDLKKLKLSGAKKPKKITFKKSSIKPVKIALPKETKMPAIKIAKAPKPKQTKSKAITISKIKPITYKKIKGMSVGKKLV